MPKQQQGFVRATHIVAVIAKKDMRFCRGARGMLGRKKKSALCFLHQHKSHFLLRKIGGACTALVQADLRGVDER